MAKPSQTRLDVSPNLRGERERMALGTAVLPLPACGERVGERGAPQAHACLIRIPRLRIADSFLSRFLGLMLRAPLASDEGLLITRCRSIHTAWMRYAIDLAYLDRSGTVLRCVPHLKPWRASFGPRSAVHVLELPAGGLVTHLLQVGQCIEHPDLLRWSRR